MRHANDNNRADEIGLRARVFRAAGRVYARAYHDLRVLSPHQLPRRGPAILICNHTSGLDPVLIQSVVPRLIVWMMDREFYEMPSLRWIFEAIDAIPVDRTGREFAATRRALRALSDGRILGVFPEGRIERTRDLLPFQTGVALMAMKAKVKVYPAYLDGTQRGIEMLQAFVQSQHASVAFGPPIGLVPARGSTDELDSATYRITDAVRHLQQGVLIQGFEKNRNKIPTEG